MRQCHLQQMDATRDCHTKWRKSEKDKYHISLIYGIQNVTQMNLSAKEKETQTKKTNLGLPRGRKSGGGTCWEFGISRCKLYIYIYIYREREREREREWLNKVQLYSTGNYIQYPVIHYNGKECVYIYIYICLTESLCCRAEINTTL